MDESISVSSMIDKLPPFWKDFKHSLKYVKDNLSLVQLGSHLRIEESLRVHDSDKGKGKEVVGPLVNMMEEGRKNKNNKQNKGKKHGFKDNNGGFGSNKKPKLECWKCGKTGHFKRDCRSGNKKNNASASGSGKGSKDQSQDQGQNLVDAIAWWIDSGATTHVCKDHYWFKTYEPVEDGSVLYMSDDHFASVHGKGSVVLEFSSGKSITLFNVFAFWKEAIDDEIGSIMENNTRVLSDLPPGCKPLGCKWIFKRKMKVDGTIDKFNARFVIQGFRQKEGIDYFDIYALVARITTIRLLLALEAIHNLVIHQMDVKTIFLNGDLEEEVYMKQPEGFVMPGNEHKVCKLVKSLYGLKQAPKQWHQKFDEVVLSSGFLLKQSDKCVYSKFDGSGKGVIIWLCQFSMKDMGEANVILGIKIKRVNKGIIITQSHYIGKILNKFNREDYSPMSTLMDLIKKLMPNTGNLWMLKYSRAIGCLMYAMTSTRPDIAYAVGRLSTMNYGLSYVGYPSVLEAYLDASWINHVEYSSSTSGWVFLLGGALAAASKEAEWLRNLIHEIPISPPCRDVDFAGNKKVKVDYFVDEGVQDANSDKIIASC
ncbi:zinc finger, CCHC-type containing protein [Tanacetum coccineum]